MDDKVATPNQEKSPWLETNGLHTAEYMLTVVALAKHCRGCGRATHVRHLNLAERCPDCRKDPA